jgi:hypothetical protein
VATFNYKCPKCDEEFVHTPNQDPLGHCGHDCRYCQTIMGSDDPNLIGQPDSNYPLFQREGTIPLGALRILTQTPAYDHCNFTVMAQHLPSAAVRRFGELLSGMSYADERVRPLLDMEGLSNNGWPDAPAATRCCADHFGTPNGADGIVAIIGNGASRLRWGDREI